MYHYDDQTVTQMAYGDIFSLCHEEEGFPDRAYIEHLNVESLFVDGILNRIHKLGYMGADDDAAQAVSFIDKLCHEANVSINRQTIKNWFAKGRADSSANGRNNIYQLCFALKMDAAQTAGFFLKCYLERPFNFKQLNEAIYFYCLNTGRTFSQARELLAKAECMPAIENPLAEDVTEQIGRDILLIQDDSELLRYLQENQTGFARQNKTATKVVRQLLEACMRDANQAAQSYLFYEEQGEVKTIDDLLRVIYGYSARATRQVKKQDAAGKEVSVTEPIYSESIAASSFPELIRRNFPQRQQFENIDKGKASYDVIRKALIILQFYHFYAEAKNKKADISNLMNGFVTETDQILQECGYVQLYWRNPFDWMIGYCADALDPLEELRHLIWEFYLQKFDCDDFSGIVPENRAR